jgi:hypothetical protein
MSGNGIHHLQNLIQTKDMVNKELISHIITKCNDLEDRIKFLEDKIERQEVKKDEEKKHRKWYWILGISSLTGILASLCYNEPRKNIYF